MYGVITPEMGGFVECQPVAALAVSPHRSNKLFVTPSRVLTTNTHLKQSVRRENRFGIKIGTNCPTCFYVRFAQRGKPTVCMHEPVTCVMRLVFACPCPVLSCPPVVV